MQLRIDRRFEVAESRLMPCPRTRVTKGRRLVPRRDVRVCREQVHSSSRIRCGAGSRATPARRHIYRLHAPICRADICAAVLDGTVVDRDQSHITGAFMASLAHVLEIELRTALAQDSMQGDKNQMIGAGQPIR